jgi:hypothetical protein
MPAERFKDPFQDRAFKILCAELSRIETGKQQPLKVIALCM